MYGHRMSDYISRARVEHVLSILKRNVTDIETRDKQAVDEGDASLALALSGWVNLYAMQITVLEGLLSDEEIVPLAYPQVLIDEVETKEDPNP